MDTTTPPRIEGFGGELIDPSHPEYEQSRRVWNAMHDCRPALVARCHSSEDVVAALGFARARELAVAVRGGGHSVAGYGTCDDGVVIDLRALSAVEVDPGRRRATVGGGALLGELDRAAQRHGLMVPAGVVSHTGVAGLTLGGGVGRMMRRFGLTIDSLRGAEVVTAAGEIVRADESSHPDLFWALRGGGGNFGIVTSFEFELHPMRDLLVLAAYHHLDDAEQVLGVADEIAPTAPKELMWSSFGRVAQGQPWIPAEMADGVGWVSFIEWSGPREEGFEVLGEIDSRLRPAAATTQPIPYLAAQTLLDEMYAHGKRSYFKAGFFESLQEPVVEVLTEQAAKIVSPFTQIEIHAMGGAIREVDPTATAFPNREPSWLINTPATWSRSTDDEREIAWSRESYRRLVPYMSEGTYVNFMDADEDPDLDGPAVIDRVFAGTLARLREVKRSYDPENVFRLNQNIAP